MIQDVCLGDIIIDCGDNNNLREFYAELLRWERCEMYGMPGVRSRGGVVFLFIQEDDYVPPIWPEQVSKQQKQMHFDFTVPDVFASVQHAEELGAIKTQEQFGGDHFTTMLDPAGHPFCLCAKA